MVCKGHGFFASGAAAAACARWQALVDNSLQESGGDAQRA
jgi:hypothetical protein